MLVVLLVALGACQPSTGAAATLSYHFADRLFAGGCETTSQCVVIGHSTRPAGTRVLVVRNGRVLRGVTPSGTDYGNNTAVSCPSRRGCVAALPLNGGWGVVVTTVDGSGRVLTTRVGAPNGVQFNAISCVTLSSCELAGVSTNGDIAMAHWSGKRRGPVSYAMPPPLQGNAFGEGNDLPTVSCSASQCEVALNYGLLDNPPQEPNQAYLVHLRHGAVDASQWLSGLAVSSLSCGTTRLCWAIVAASDGSSGPQLTPIDNGVVGSPGPLNVPASALACWSFTCAVVGKDQLTIFVSGVQTVVQTVAATSYLYTVTPGPGGVFAAIGSAEPSGSVLAIFH